MMARDVMTHDVAMARPGDMLIDAVRLMLARDIGGVPVVDATGALVGMLGEDDLLRRHEIDTDRHPSWLHTFLHPRERAEEFAHSYGRRVREVMCQDVQGVAETTPLGDVVALMQARHLARVPVLHLGHVVGIIARADLVKALARVLHGPSPVAREDGAIGAQLHAELARASWMPGSTVVTLTVTDGRVQLYGSFPDAHIRQAIRVVAENVPGVRSVTDHLDYVDPASVAYPNADCTSEVAS